MYNLAFWFNKTCKNAQRIKNFVFGMKLTKSYVRNLSDSPP